MENMYWIFEYGKVLTAYLFLMFVWPLVVFRRLLRGKSLTFQVCFCPTCSIVLVNTVVLFLGLFHLLNKWTVMLFFYGIFIYSLLHLIPFKKKYVETLKKLLGREYGLKMFLSRTRRLLKASCAGFFNKIWLRIKPHQIEYLLLFIMIIYGMIFYSWGAFQDHSYGFSDTNVHHSWTYALTQGQIFSNGVYPEAMHCFIYTMHVLGGITIYSCNLFFGPIHIMVFLLSAYCMFKEVFGWRGSVLIALALFLIMQPDIFESVYSLARLQCTLPQEFGLFTEFLCPAFLVRYLKSSHHPRRGRKITRRVWDDNLLMFGLALSASISSHFYVTMMAFFMCLGFLVLSLRKIFRKTHFLPLVTAAVLGLFISFAPMAGALASGIPFQGSIDWAMSLITGSGSKNENANNQDNKTPSPAPSDSSAGNQTAGSPEDGITWNPQTPSGTETVEPKENIIHRFTRILGSICGKLTTGVIENGYYSIYPKLGKMYLLLSILSGIMLAAYKAVTAFVKKYVPDFVSDPHSLDGHAKILAVSYLFMLVYVFPMIGLPNLIESIRLFSTIHLLLLSVAILPLDMLFSTLAACFSRGLMNILSVCALAASCFLVVGTGNYHSYLFFSLIRYNGPVNIVAQLVDTYPQYTYTVVSPTDELYQIIQYGRHTDLYEFMSHIRYDEEYYIPTEYVFIFVEKRALSYAQYHFFRGPAWLAREASEFQASYMSHCPQVNSLEISAESAAELYHTTRVWDVYKNLENRVILESRAYLWCQNFARLYTYETEVYYEDEDLICYRIHQNPQRLFNMVIK